MVQTIKRIIQITRLQIMKINTNVTKRNFIALQHYSQWFKYLPSYRDQCQGHAGNSVIYALAMCNALEKEVTTMR